MRFRTVAVLASWAMSLSALAQQPAKGTDELSALLKEFLAGASRNDAATHERFWAEELVYTSSAGRRIGKADILEDVRATPPPKPGDPTVVYSAEDVRIQRYGDAAIVAFRLVGATTKEGKTEIAKYWNTGTFQKRGGRWQAVAWQATRMAPPEAAMTQHARGTFEVKLAPQDAGADAQKEMRGRMSIEKQFLGDLEGTSLGEMLTAMTAVKDSAGYVAIERVTGKLQGRSGSFALQHRGTMDRGKQDLSITVVPDSGTGELEGITGRMAIEISAGKHSYDFEYNLPKAGK
jgi:hypothetical protein